jgi:hypothetical protein
VSVLQGSVVAPELSRPSTADLNASAILANNRGNIRTRARLRRSHAPGRIDNVGRRQQATGRSVRLDARTYVMARLWYTPLHGRDALGNVIDGSPCDVVATVGMPERIMRADGPKRSAPD